MTQVSKREPLMRVQGEAATHPEEPFAYQHDRDVEAGPFPENPSRSDAEGDDVFQQPPHDGGYGADSQKR